MPEETRPSPVDLNTAPLAALRKLPGVGRGLAASIIQHRQTHGPFASPDDLARVPGIGRVTLQKLSGRIIATAPAPQAGEVGEATPAAAASGESPPGAIPAAEAAPAPEPGSPGGAQAPAPTAEAPPAPTAGPAPRPAPPPTAGAARPSIAARRDWLGLVGMSFLGAIFGAVLALAAVAGLNRGTLLLNQRAEVRGLQMQAEALSGRIAVLETETAALRARLSALEGLTARVEAAERDLAQMRAALDAARADLAAVDRRSAALAAELEAVRGAAERFEGFLAGLREVLNRLPAAPAPAPTATPLPGR